jgi:hypothetical protein
VGAAGFCGPCVCISVVVGCLCQGLQGVGVV